MRFSITAALSVLGFLFPAFAFASFPDVPSNHPNYDSILYVQEQGIVSGYPDKTFHPDQSINRAEFTKIVTLTKYGQAMIDMCGSRAQFSDVPPDAWYIKYVCRAKDSGLITGYPDRTFRPEQNINFVEASKILSLAAFNSVNLDLPEDTGGPWYDIYVRYLTERNAIPVSIASFDHYLTRGEMAEIIYRLKENITTKTSATFGQSVVQPPSSVGPCGSLIFDAETGLCMEKAVSKFFTNTIRSTLRTCDNCSNLPNPTVSLDGGKNAAALEIFLNNKPLLTWAAPGLINDNAVISNPGNVLATDNGRASGVRVNGTNTITYLVSSEGNYFQNRYDRLIPGQTTKIQYSIVKKNGKHGSAYFFVEENTHIDLDATVRTFDSVASKTSSLAGLQTPEPYYAIVMPPMLGVVFGVEGNFYFGDHILMLGYGGEKYFDENPTILTQEMGHEYVHLIQDTQHITSYPAAFMTEGMADAVAIYNGFRTWKDVSVSEHIEPGCIDEYGNTSPHNLGRCVFKHLEQAGYFTPAFFDHLFHPIGNYQGLVSCKPDFQDDACVADLQKVLSFLTGKDMSDLIRVQLQAK